jgi:hypothetical protein
MGRMQVHGSFGSGHQCTLPGSGPGSHCIEYHWEHERWHLWREAAPPSNPQGLALPAAGCDHNYVYECL